MLLVSPFIRISLSVSSFMHLPGLGAAIRTVKTNSSAKKRFKLTSSGALRRAHAGKSHNTGKHKRKIIRGKGNTTTISGSKIERNMRRLLGLSSQFPRV
jgi:large subunit ribosomal protein L35